jgi:CDP-paratose 2-epimerase
MREIFFGPNGSTLNTTTYLKHKFSNFSSFNIDLVNNSLLAKHFESYNYDLIIHAAGQPSHDKAAEIPFLDFSTNAIATLNLLELYRNQNSKTFANFIFMSTNKVYGENPNLLHMKELTERFEFADEHFENGIDEKMGTDQTKHSLFGVSKLSADLLVQEYGRYFDLNTIVLRGGCLTGPNHASVALHGFLSYLIKTVKNKQSYTIIGFSGKQVRDQIHSLDVAQAILQLSTLPLKGEVFNIGGGYKNSASILEIIKILEQNYSIKAKTNYNPVSRSGDHKCYYSNLDKLRNYLNNFELKYSLPGIIEDIFNSV